MRFSSQVGIDGDSNGRKSSKKRFEWLVMYRQIDSSGYQEEQKRLPEER
jgi:hypothetical protein